MPDPELVAYLRKNLKQFGAEPLRAKLIEEGLGEEEIDDAMAAAIRPARKKPPLMMYLVFAGAVVGAVAAFMALDKPAAGPAAGPAPATITVDPTPGGPSGDKPAKGGFMGHYGYMLKLPDGYVTQTTFKDLGDTTEVVYLAPEKTDPTNYNNEGLYGQLGILRMEVSPRRIPQGTVGLDGLKAAVTGHLTQRGVTFTTRDLSVSGLQGFQVTVTQPFPMVQAFLIGTKVMYVLTGGTENQTFTDTLLSLNEVSP